MVTSLHPIKTETDYYAALSEIESLFDAKPGTSEADRLELLSILVEAYEQQHHLIAPPDPIEAILYHLEPRGLSDRDLEVTIGSQAQDILNRRQPLMLEMIRQLHDDLGISADILIQLYPLDKFSV